MLIKDIMSTDVITSPPDAVFETLACKLACLPNRAVHVVEPSGKLLGIVTSLDIISRLAPFYLDSNLARAVADIGPIVKRAMAEHKTDTARTLMTAEPVVLRTGDTVLEADTLLREKGVNVLPVVDGNGVLVGEITRKDILRHLVLDCGQCACDVK